MKEIEQYISNYFGFSGHELTDVSQQFTLQTVERNSYLLKIGQYAKSLSIVQSGFLRLYAYNVAGDKEVTQWIAAPGMFVTDLSSLIFDAPARWHIQALTHCELFTITKERYRNLGQIAANWAEVEKLFLAKCFVTIENRVFSQLSMTAEQKVRQLFDMNPELFNLVPLQYIASMLGMTPETLSRIRKNLTS